jgi:hypothetical protein
MTVDVQLWFSTDDDLDRTAGADIMSPTIKKGVMIQAATSALRKYRFELPATVTLNMEYYPIIFVDSGASFGSEESQKNNWIPLRRTITARAFPDFGCPSSPCLTNQAQPDDSRGLAFPLGGLDVPVGRGFHQFAALPLVAKLCRSELGVSTTGMPLTPDIRLRFDRCRPMSGPAVGGPHKAGRPGADIVIEHQPRGTGGCKDAYVCQLPR